MDELKPCPFCGGKAEQDKDGQFFIARCNDCLVETAGRRKNVVVARWNTRPAPDQIRREALEAAAALVDELDKKWKFGTEWTAKSVAGKIRALTDAPAPTGDRVQEAARVLLDDKDAVDQIAACICANGGVGVRNVDVGCALEDLSGRALAREERGA